MPKIRRDFRHSNNPHADITQLSEQRIKPQRETFSIWIEKETCNLDIKLRVEVKNRTYDGSQAEYNQKAARNIIGFSKFPSYLAAGHPTGKADFAKIHGILPDSAYQRLEPSISGGAQARNDRNSNPWLRFYSKNKESARIEEKVGFSPHRPNATKVRT